MGSVTTHMDLTNACAIQDLPAQNVKLTSMNATSIFVKMEALAITHMDLTNAYAIQNLPA